MANSLNPRRAPAPPVREIIREETLSLFAELLQTASRDLLVNALQDSTIDPRMLVGHELACRGLAPDGRWVGFPEAERLFLARFPSAREAGVLV